MEGLFFGGFFGGVRAFSLSRVNGVGQFLEMGDLVKIGGLPLSRWVFCFRWFLGVLSWALVYPGRVVFGSFSFERNLVTPALKRV